MPDVVDTATRSRMMAGIRGRDTQPERSVRSALFRLGYRFKIDVRSLPGRPDIVLPRYRTVIFVHGCFWHGHDCRLFRLPETRKLFWSSKIDANRARDEQCSRVLDQLGWRRLIIWECSIKGAGRIGIDEVARRADAWIRGNGRSRQIRGKRS